MMRYKAKLWAKLAISILVVFSLTGQGLVPAPVAEAAVAHPLFLNVSDINSKIANYPWAEDMKDNIVDIADQWLGRTINVYSDSTWHGHSSFYICPTHQSKLYYEFMDSMPSQFLCSGNDGVFGTADDHYVTSADTTAENWLSIQRGWGASWFLDHTSAAQSLGYAYVLTNNMDYANKCAEILTDIAGKYPGYTYHDVYGNTGSSATTKRGKATCQWLTEADSFLMRLCRAYDLIYNSGALNSQQKSSIENMFNDSVNNVLPTTATDPSTGPTSNWWAYNAAARATYGYLFENTTQQQMAKDTLDYLLQKSVKADGFWYEGTIGYHNYALSALIDIAEAAYRRGGTVHENLYSKAGFKKMFDVLLKLPYPNLEVQSNNDSASVPDNIDSAARLLEIAYSVYGDDKYKDMLNAIYDAGTERGSADSKLYTLKAGVCPLPPGDPVEYGDEDLPGVGTMILRNYTDTSDKLMATLDYGEHGGSHGHYDKLNITTYGLGRVWAMDLGIGSYQSTLANDWYKTTVGHNTVSIPNTKQKQTTGRRDFFGSTKNMDVAKVSAATAYPELSDYERAIIMVRPYVLDIFDTGADASQTYDWSLHCPDSTLSVSGVTLTSQTGALGTSNGYQNITSVKRGSTNGQWSATFTDKTDTNKKYKITMIPLGTATEVITGLVPDIGTKPTMKIPKVVARRTRSAGSFKFTVLHEAYNTTSQIASVTTDANAILVTKTDGDQQWLYNNMGSSKFSMVWKNSAGSIKSIDAVNTNSVVIGTTDYLSAANTADSYNATVSGSTLDISQVPASLGKVDVYVGAANITAVSVNGSPVSFTRNGNYVTYGVLSSKSDFSAVSGLYGKTGIQTIEYDVTPLSNGIDGVTGFADSSTSVNAYSDLAMIVRMNVSGYFDARNGGSYSAMASLPYSAGIKYRVKLVANLMAGTYDVYVTPEGGAQTRIAQDYAFRSDAPPTDDLGKICLVSSTGNDQFKIENICSSVVAYNPTDDSYIHGDTGADTNYGSSASLAVKGSSAANVRRMAYLKFDFSALDREVCSRAILRVYGYNSVDTTTVPVKVYGLMNDEWSEATMTWNNGSPNHDSTDSIVTEDGRTATYIGSLNVNDNGRYYEIDVTSFVNSNMDDKTVSFVLADEGHMDKYLTFNSKEAASNRPELVISDIN